MIVEDVQPNGSKRAAEKGRISLLDLTEVFPFGGISLLGMTGCHASGRSVRSFEHWPGRHNCVMDLQIKGEDDQPIFDLVSQN